MKKFSVLFVLVLVFSSLSYAKETKSKYPKNFSCVIEEQYISGDASKSNTFDYYKIGKKHRWDAFEIAYLFEDNKKTCFNVILSMDVYCEMGMDCSVLEKLDDLGGGFLYPEIFSNTEDTGETEVINGYECKKMKVIFDKDDNSARFVWQAPQLGNFGMKYEVTNDNEKYILVVNYLDLGFKDSSVFKLPSNKADLMMF